MSRLSAVAGLSCSCLFVVWPRIVLAADPVSETLPEVVVSSTRLPDAPVDPFTLPAKVTVITAEDMVRSGAKTVQEAIQWATGIVMFNEVGNEFEQRVDLRGFNGQPVTGTSVFVDGVRVNEPDFNAVNYYLIPVETIERIEIIPGTSAIYGKNAMGGVINIITKRGTVSRSTTGEAFFGSFNRQRYTINTAGPVGKFDYFANFSRETEDGFRDESDARISRATGKLGYRPTDRTDLSVSYNYVRSRLMEAGSLPLSVAAFDRKANFTPGDFNLSEVNFVTLSGRQQLPLGFSLTGNLFYRHLAQELFTVGQTSISDLQNKTEARGGTVQLGQDAMLFGRKNVFTGGAEFTRNDVGSRSLSTFTGFGSFPGSTTTGEDIFALFAQDSFSILSHLILTVGVRYDHDQFNFSDDLSPINNGSTRFSRTTPRAGLTYLVTPSNSLYFNFSQGFRVPTFFELFALGPFGSNPNLKPVRSNNYEIGTKNRIGSQHELQVALFQSDVRNEIFFTCILCDFSAGDGQNRNIDRSRRRGVEVTAKGRYSQYFDATVNYTYTEAHILTPIRLSSTQVVTPGDTFPLVPKHRLGVTGNVYPATGWTVSLMGLYVSTQFFLNDEINAQPRLPGYFRMDARVAYERSVPGGLLKAFLMLNNILDQKYSTSGILASNVLTGGGATERFVVPAPGIAIYGGLSYTFNAL
jgi:iron complex outermembrane receptor protein